MSTDGVLITGSYNYPRGTAELYVPSSGESCSLPKLDIRYKHSVESSGLLCGGGYHETDTSNTCLKWSPDTGSWEEEEQHLHPGRWNHVSWTPDNGMGTYLMGGANRGTTTTLIKHDGTQEAAFPLQYDTE